MSSAHAAPAACTPAARVLAISSMNSLPADATSNRTETGLGTSRVTKLTRPPDGWRSVRRSRL